MFQAASAINYVSQGAPPVFLWYTTPNLPMTPDLEAGPGIHHPRFGHILKEKMDALGVECVVRCREDLPDLPEEVWAAHRRVARDLDEASADRR